MLGQQQHSSHRKSLENMSSPSLSGGSGQAAWTSSPQGSSSFSSFKDMEVPLGGTTSLNDDAREKSIRRRSLLDERAARRRSLLSMNAQAGAGGADDGENRRRSMNQGGINSGSNPNLASPNSRLRPSGPSSLLGIVESHQPNIPSLVKVNADSFEQWLKLATDNKINANNSWNFALIDYFHEMSLLREGDSINFQKEGHGQEGAHNSDDNDDDENDKPAKKKSTNRSGNTLAKDFSAISLDKFNLEFAVDPLFKKTCADFDEGGARGLLLNHLSVDVEGKIIFDAGDARDEGDDDDNDDEEDENQEPENPASASQDSEGQEEKQRNKRTDVESTKTDIQRLRAKFLPSLNSIFEKDICPSLKDFQLSGTSEMDSAFLKRFYNDEDDEDEDHGIHDQDMSAYDPEMSNIENGYDDFDDEDNNHDDGFFDQSTGDVDGEGGAELGEKRVKEEEVEDAFGDLDEQIAAQRQGPQLDNNALQESDNLLGKDPADMYSYFDVALMRNWAGPAHWKLRRIRTNKNGPTEETNGETGDTTVANEENNPKKRGGKTAFSIDFVHAEEVDEEELFAQDESSNLTFSDWYMAEHRKTKNLLPDDIHFSSKQLLRMFRKQTYIIKSKNTQKGYRPKREEPEIYNLVDPDEEFWASHTANVDLADTEVLTEQLDNTQIYNDYMEDDEDEYGFADQGFFAPGGGLGGFGLGMGLDGDGNDYASQLVSQPKRVKTATINYSRTAKKVDVKKLKDNMWKELTSQALKRRPGSDDSDRNKHGRKKANTEQEQEQGDGAGEGEGEKNADNDSNDKGTEQVNTEDEEDYGDYVKKEQRFTEVIGGLSKLYPEQKLRDISVPFCFISLLHLANEKNLAIVGTEDLGDLIITQP
ncbi:hypothetical protein BGZ94_004016 [Podila epigama]|nr:hypothetical protein BGZ94_004016 [Podila epigama]